MHTCTPLNRTRSGRPFHHTLSLFVWVGCAALCSLLLLTTHTAQAQDPAPSSEEEPIYEGPIVTPPTTEDSTDQTTPSPAGPVDDTTEEPNGDTVEENDEEDESDGEEDPFSTTTTGTRYQDPGRATSRVTKQQLDERQPRSAPDALRYEPGVYVQQTAQSQGSPYIRGRTGQQTVLMFDHVRMNNSLFRQGPNQYFFTIDSRTIHDIEVLRGSASTRYGSDAIAGVIHAFPTNPTIHPEEQGLRLTPRLMARHTTADDELGGRVQIDAQYGNRLGILGGFGYRNVGKLESGGPIYSPRNGRLPEVPRFDEDGRTQLGTGFKELTGDARLVFRLTPKIDIIAAYYDYRQSDAPRTDQCAPAYAPFDECLVYDNQDRTVVYTALDGELGTAAKSFRLTLSYQFQHERRTHSRPSSNVINGGRDDVGTLGFALKAQTAEWVLNDDIYTSLRYGVDGYHDRVESVSWIIFNDPGREPIINTRSRGQYVDGSTYTWSGIFAENEWIFWDSLILKAGGRASIIQAQADGDEESGTQEVDRTWTALVGNVGAEWIATDWMSVVGGIDQGFRAPNLDDLTSRQRTGPGFQFENPNLEPERALTKEVGLKISSEFIDLDFWVYHSSLSDTIARSTRDIDDCPDRSAGSACNNTWSRVQLVNLDGEASIWGYEGSILARGPYGLEARATLSYAFGEGPNPLPRNPESPEDYEERLPLSRIPPLNGTAELMWRTPEGFYLGGAMRWATLQDRLDLGDVSDERIPEGGTPGFRVFDLRTGYRNDPYTLISVTFENITDEAYRYHGSSVNGPGRSFIFGLELGL